MSPPEVAAMPWVMFLAFNDSMVSQMENEARRMKQIGERRRT
jgi:hypothetical protein